MLARAGSSGGGRLPPEMAANFDVGAAVGKGASGTVYRGRERCEGGSGVLVAIKAVATRSMPLDKQDQLIQEIGTLKRCSHTNIVALKAFYGSASTAQVFIVMEWCGQGDLENFIDRRGSQLPSSASARSALRVLEERVALHFMRQLSAALRFLRSIDIVHGDLKPANLLLTTAASSSSAANSSTGAPALPQLKVGDFGLAQSLRGEESSSRLHGTALYLAPELVLTRSFNAGCDLWSSGSILHRMLYGWPSVHPPGPQQNDLDAALRRIASLGGSGDDGGAGAGGNRDVIMPPPLPRSPPAPAVSEICKALLLSLLQPRPEQRIAFDDLWRHPCIDLPRRETADAAAAAAEGMAAAAYEYIDLQAAVSATTVLYRDAVVDAQPAGCVGCD